MGKLNNNAISFGFNLVSGMIVFSGIGYWIDQRKGTEYWTLIGMFVGLLYCGYEAWKLLSKGDHDSRPKKDP